MQVGDLVRRTPLIPDPRGFDKRFGIVVGLRVNAQACKVAWFDGSVSLPFVNSLEVLSTAKERENEISET